MARVQEKKENTFIDKPFTLEEYRRLYPLHQNKFKSMKVSIASPEQILSWSSGEVQKSETVNYKTGKPEKAGLFCEIIFGPSKDFECSCGKYKYARDRSVKKCEICQVDITSKIVRRIRMGHIKLEEPVAHIWYHKISGAQAIPSLLDGSMLTTYGANDEPVLQKCSIKNALIDAILHYQCYILVDLKELDNKYTGKLVKPFMIFRMSDLKTERFIRGEKTDPKSGKMTKTPSFLDRLESYLDEYKRDEKNYQRLKEEIHTKRAEMNDDVTPFNLTDFLELVTSITGAVFQTGAAAIRELLTRLDVSSNLKRLKRDLTKLKRNIKIASTTTSKTRKTKKAKKKTTEIPAILLRKIEMFESFNKQDVKPEWTILEVIPVIPADLRPMIALDGGRYSTTEINELYRQIAIRNAKIKRLKAGNAPDSFLLSSKRLLQEAVDTLIDNKKRANPRISKRNYLPQKSLADILLGKKGRFRQNLLGKRVDFSGRSVITVGPNLKLFQCGLPKEHALELYRPFIVAEIIEQSKVEDDEGIITETMSIKMAEKWIKEKDSRVWPVVRKVMKTRPVLLNRAPTLHRLGIQAFEPILVEGRAIQLHPLSTAAFNADFDGDQMAVHLPLSDEAVNEARTRMIGSSNILGPKDGKPIATPSQDMTLGIFYLTMEITRAFYEKSHHEIVSEEIVGEGKVFASTKQALSAYENKYVSLHSVIGVKVSGLGKSYLYEEDDMGKILMTTIGKLMFNSIIPAGVAYINSPNQHTFNKKRRHDLSNNIQEFMERVKNYTQPKTPFNKKFVTNIVGEVFDIVQLRAKDEFEVNSIVAKMLDGMKELGFKYSTVSGISIAYSDIFVPEEKEELLSRTERMIRSMDDYNRRGYFSKGEYTRKIVSMWNGTKERLQKVLKERLAKESTNPIFLMATSGARGNESNFTQLMGMRGIMTNPQGEAIAIPVKSSFSEGLGVNEFFISTHGARKGNVDTSMKTGVSGYLTRIFIDSCQNVVIEEPGEELDRSYPVRAITEVESLGSSQERILVPLRDRIYGRFAAEDVVAQDGKIIVRKDELMTRAISEEIANNDIQEVRIRSILTSDGFTQKAYGLDLGTNNLVKLDTAVGVIAAQAIGEPGTQLTMNTFHTGGVADDADITQGLPLIESIVKFQRVGSREVAKEEDIITKEEGVVTAITQSETSSSWFNITVEREVPRGKAKPIISSRVYKIRRSSKLLVQKGQTLKAGQRLTEGKVQLYKLWKYAGIADVYQEVLKEFHKVYRLQGIEISDKYFEIVIKQMTSKMRILTPGDTGYVPGEYVNIRNFKKRNAVMLEKGKTPAYARLWVLSSVKSSLLSDSFLWAVSFQETTQHLAKAAIKGRVDHLLGLKENIIFGNLIPVGTGKLSKEEIIFENNAIDKNKY